MFEELNRREVLGAAAAAGLLAGTAAADAPGNAVADRTSQIRCKSLRGFVVGPKVYYKIETNLGVTGWGEVTGSEPKVAVALAESLFELLDNENPTRVEHLWQKMFRSHRDMRGGPLMVHVISGIDMALWDIAGKLWGVSVYRLLGGPVRDKVRMYPLRNVAEKLGTGGPHPLSPNPPGIQRPLKMIEGAPKRMGAEGPNMFCAPRRPPPPPPLP